MIDELKNFESNTILELRYPPFLFSKKTQNIVVNDIINRSLLNLLLKDNGEIIIETHTIETALCGELIAQKLNCKHFIFLLQEFFGKTPVSIMDYLDFKHKRKELVGISKKSLELLFKNYKTLHVNEKYSLKAVCSTNIVEDVDNPIIDNISKMDINIGCISRLEKSFINTMIDEIVYFAKRNKNKNIQLILIGGAPNISIEQNIIKKVKNAENIKLIMMGQMFPIPRKLFRIMDIFIGVSGSSHVSAYEGVLSMTLDVQSHKPIGLLGYDTQEFLYASSGTNTSISTVLENVLIKRQLQNQNINIKLESIDFRKEFNNHLDFIRSSAKDKEYHTISIMDIGVKNMIKKVLITIMGIKGYENLLKLMQKRKDQRI